MLNYVLREDRVQRSNGHGENIVKITVHVDLAQNKTISRIDRLDRHRRDLLVTLARCDSMSALDPKKE